MEYNYYSGIFTNNLDIFSFDQDEPESNWTAESHDLNALSLYLLNATAFTPGISMGSGEHLPYSADKDISKTYNTISKTLTPSNLLLQSSTEIVDQSRVDYDRVGILFPYKALYFVIMESHFPSRKNRSFPDKHRVGSHLVCE
jgi:hypothetical protein